MTLKKKKAQNFIPYHCWEKLALECIKSILWSQLCDSCVLEFCLLSEGFIALFTKVYKMQIDGDRPIIHKNTIIFLSKWFSCSIDIHRCCSYYLCFRTLSRWNVLVCLVFKNIVLYRLQFGDPIHIHSVFNVGTATYNH